MAVLLDIMLPENLQATLIQVQSACNFDFYDTETLYTDFFKFGETESFSEEFEAAGLDGSNFVIGMGTMFMFVVTFPIILALKAIGRRFCSCCCNQRWYNFFLA